MVFFFTFLPALSLPTFTCPNPPIQMRLGLRESFNDITPWFIQIPYQVSSQFASMSFEVHRDHLPICQDEKTRMDHLRNAASNPLPVWNRSIMWDARWDERFGLERELVMVMTMVFVLAMAMVTCVNIFAKEARNAGNNCVAKLSLNEAPMALFISCSCVWGWE